MNVKDRKTDVPTNRVSNSPEQSVVMIHLYYQIMIFRDRKSSRAFTYHDIFLQTFLLFITPIFSPPHTCNMRKAKILLTIFPSK